MNVRRAIAVAVLAITPIAAVAQLSETYRDWARGPVQWLMTKEESRAWNAVKSDQQADEFVDLFWARRDPTPGTPANEFRADWDARVAFADVAYKGKTGTRGSLTEMGRVYLLLGPPNDLDTHIAGAEASAVEGRAISQLGGRYTFNYDNPTAKGLNGPVVFVQNANGDYKIDTQRGGVFGALSLAQKKAIVSPDLTSVPAWADRQTAKPKPRGQVQIITKQVQAAPGPQVILTGAPGATLLTLVKDITVIRAQSGNDPFATLTSLSNFTRQDELGYAFQFCAASETAEPTLTVATTISGLTGGERVNMKAEAEEVSPERIRNMPGCYLVRASIPLAEVTPGDYKISLAINDTTNNQKYNLAHDFKVE